MTPETLEMTPDFTGTIMVKAIAKDLAALFAITIFVLMIGAICMALDAPAIPV